CDESEDDRPAVQVGDPFLEKSLVEACLEALKTGAVVAAQDMGAAGITCSTSEMAANGGVGVDVDLDKVPIRETGMVPYEYLLSESQERMLFVAQKGREQKLIDIFERWGLHAVVVGEVIADPIVRIRFQGSIAAEIPATALANDTPIYHRELITDLPDYVKAARQWSTAQLPACDREGLQLSNSQPSWEAVLKTLLDSPTLASKRWVYRQYDHQVQNNTVLLPGGSDAAIIRLRPQTGNQARDFVNTRKGIAATVDCNGRYVYLDPYAGAQAAVAEAARNLSCVGAEPIAVTDNLNFGSPEKPIGYWQLAEATRGLADGCHAFKTPVTGGNVSLYNETLDNEGNPTPIYPTPVVGMVGLVPDVTRTCGQGWRQSGDTIYLLGISLQSALTPTDQLTLGASEYLAVIHKMVAGRPPQIDTGLETAVQAACRHGIRQGWVQSAHDCAEGGLAVALAECSISGQAGAIIQLPITTQDVIAAAVRWDQLLFAEGGARIVVSVAPTAIAQWEAHLAEQLTGQWQRLGTVQAPQTPLSITTAEGESLLSADLLELTHTWETAIERRLQAT
ncbi:MAG: phosphoribosylformylglycinamidine synthase II, partial [Leptolyngbya sp. SIO1D8]|nr:phosphoribosylformylglycinamidine synthase II [Leptolyngbya sp. SIO1D8]